MPAREQHVLTDNLVYAMRAHIAKFHQSLFDRKNKMVYDLNLNLHKKLCLGKYCIYCYRLYDPLNHFYHHEHVYTDIKGFLAKSTC